MILKAAAIMFICVSANHLGLISKIEEVLNCELPVINCPKCATWWITMFCTIRNGILPSVALSFAFAYIALWAELTMCVVDNLYKRIYEKIIPDPASDTSASDSYDDDADSTVSDMR